MSIRKRIFLWLFGSLTLAAILLFGTFYTLTSRLLYLQTDREIETHATAIVNIASQQMNLFTQQVLENSPGMMLVVGNPQGQIVASSLPDSGSQREMSLLIQKSAGIIETTFITKDIGTNRMRIGIFPVAANGTTQLLVLVGHPTDVIDHALARLVYQLVLALGLIILLSLLLTSWITRAIMAPIERLTSQLEAVSGANMVVEIAEPKTAGELARLSRAFASMMGRIRSAFERERQLIGELAHELKTPLAVAKSKLELVSAKPRQKEEYMVAAKEAGKSVDKIGETLTEMLDLAWASSEQPLGPEDKVRLDLLLEEAMEVAEALGAEKSLKFKKKIEVGTVVAGKRDKLFRVLLNVLDNAVKYSPRGGTVTVLLEREGDKAKLEVSNAGAGISEADLPHIFEPYYRGRAAGKKKGTGLGLAIVKRIVEAHGGEVILLSQIRKLISIVIKLPIYGYNLH